MTFNTQSASYSLGSCPLAMIIAFPDRLITHVIQINLTVLNLLVLSFIQQIVEE